MMGYHFLMLTLAASVYASFATTDLVVPEKIDFAAYSTSTSFIQAMTKSGGTEADCRTFATTTISSIKDEVEDEQKTLDAIDTGSECAQEGQTLVRSTATALSAAQTDLVNKQAAAAIALSRKNAACSASVAFAVNLDTLHVKTCYDYTSEATYISANAACGLATTASTKADQAVITAKTVVSDAQTAHDAAVAEAARLKSACHCRVQREQATAWTAASAATAAHAADWKQAHKVICALDKTESCYWHTCPEVKKYTLSSNVSDEDCSIASRCGDWAQPGFVGKAPNCPIAEGFGTCSSGSDCGYRYTTLENCKTRCEENPSCNLISRFNGCTSSQNTRNWHCWAYNCPDLENIEWVPQVKWGNGASSSCPWTFEEETCKK